MGSVAFSDVTVLKSISMNMKLVYGNGEILTKKYGDNTVDLACSNIGTRR